MSGQVQTIGKYQVENVLGRGGMGTVYKALDPIIHRQVALKTMNAGLADDPELRARFLREAQAAGGLRHRNIVTVYDLGDDKGQPYIAMEYIEGTDLEKIIQNREPHSIEWKLDVLRQVCEGLAYAHRSGIVHRDVKPANIRVTPEGDVKIMDFGVAHLQSSTMTKTGLVLGTVHYMAPEQVEGRKVDHRADVFAVGAIAYELIANRKPFEGESLTTVMFKIIHERPDPAALPATPYSPGLERIVMKALARDLDERYQSLDDMHADLERLVRAAAPAVIEQLASAPGGGSAPAGSQWDEASEALRSRVEREMSEIRAEMERARSEGQFQKALGLCRRLLELEPEDESLSRTAGEIEDAIHEREVDQFSEMALSYAADGDFELALKICGRIEKIAPHSAKGADLKSYLEEESAKRTAEILTSTAQEHLVLGNLEEARAAAEEALAVQPDHAIAREIRDRAAGVMASRDRARGEAATLSMPQVSEAAPAPPPPAETPDEDLPATVSLRAVTTSEPLAAAPVAPPAVPPAEPPIPMPPPADVAAPTPMPEPAPPPPSSPPQPSPTATPAPAAPAPAAAPAAASPVAGGDAASRKAEAAAHTANAMNHFMTNNYAKARKAAEKALALEPENRKAKELMKILGALG